MDFKQRKLEKILRKGNEYLQKLQYSNEEQIVQLSKSFPALKDQLAIRDKQQKDEINDLESRATIEANIKSNLLKILVQSKGTLRSANDKWTIEMVCIFLLKVFDSYDFDKLKYIMEKKLVLEDQFLISHIGISDKANFFINETLKTDKYLLLKYNLISKEQLLKWKYRALVKESERKSFDLDKLNEEDKIIVQKLFY